MLRTQPHHVVTLGDFTKSDGIPDNFLSSGRHSENTAPDNIGGTIVFGLNMYMEMLAKIFAKVFPKSSKGLMIVSNREAALEKAYELINELQSK